jgi:hypothetical protein
VRRYTLLIAVGLVMQGGLSLAETVPAERFRPVARTAHAVYFATGGQGVDVRRSEAYIGQLVSLFGPAPAGSRIEYYRHASATALRDRVGFEASGVTDPGAGRVDSVRAFHPHELVHAVAGRLGRPPVFFAEGLAVALTSAGRWHGRDLDAVAREALTAGPSLEPFLTRFTEQDPDTAYAVAGSLAAYLLDRFGIEPMVAFFRGCGSSPEGYESAFRRAYGRTVARATLDWEQALAGQATTASREWYDPAGWPGSLRRGGETLEASARPAPPTFSRPEYLADAVSTPTLH